MEPPPHNHEAWPREEEEYLMRVADQSQYLSIQYNEIYNLYRTRETRFKLPVIILGSAVGMLSFGASQFGPENTERITIGAGFSSVVISIVSAIEAYLKIGETMTNSLMTATQLKKLKEKIDFELAILPEHRTASSTTFLRQCHTEYIDIVEKAPPLQYRGILSRLVGAFKSQKKSPGPSLLPPPNARHDTLLNKFRSIVQLAQQRKTESAMDFSTPAPSPGTDAGPARPNFRDLLTRLKTTPAPAPAPAPAPHSEV